MRSNHNTLLIPMSITGISMIVVCVLGCAPSASSNERPYDSLFLGLRFGMDRQQFFDYCSAMNKQKLLAQGPAGREVEFKLTGILPNTVSMRFYPSFYEDRIYEMPVLFSYDAWAPWNRSFQSDSLFARMLPILEQWYGKGFRELRHPSYGRVFVKRDGYRRIDVFIRDDQFVQAIFTDLDAENAIKEAGARGN